MFFFSSRRRHTRFDCDWSSDVCSSDLWHAVKEALLASGVIGSRPKTEYAKQAGQELVNNYGFRQLPVDDPYQAPVGSVLVYNANRAAGHVEIRAKDWVVSGFCS